ncbi:Uncharacterised protein [Vibrio cholerae]|nr:Uncharacterised protein [Vibrio cholerae]
MGFHVHGEPLQERPHYPSKDRDTVHYVALCVVNRRLCNTPIVAQSQIGHAVVKSASLHVWWLQLK